MKTDKTILIIEDNHTLSNLIEHTIKNLGYNTHIVCSAEDALNWLESNTPFLMILDYVLPNMNGKELIITLLDKNKTISPFIIATGSGNEHLFIEMMKLGAKDYLIKDNNFIDMLPMIIESINNDIENENNFKNAMKELSYQKKFFEQMFIQSSISTQILDKDGWCERINPPLTELFGVDPKDIEGKIYNIFKDQSIIDGGVIPYLEKTFYEKKPTEWEVFFDIGKAADSQDIKIREKKIRWFFTRAYPILDDNGELINVIIQHRDITENKRVENDLIIAKNKAEESDRLKSEFLANMSHEIRTPMNSILGFSSLIDKNTPIKKIEDYMSIIKNSGNLLMTLIDDIIELSKIQSGVFKIEKEYCDIKNMMIRTEEEYNQHIINKNKNIKLILEIDNNKCNTFTDIKRIKQILNNLIGNAIKFTNEGSITYGYYIVDNNILFFVKDTGIGITDENKDKIFDRFYQIMDKNQKKQEGTGLGLTICKAIVTLLNGDIWVESEFGIGSNFYFTIPLDNTQEKLIQPIIKQYKKQYDWSNKKVLIVEDDEINYQLFEIVLLKTKINIRRASNGDEFFKIIETNNYDIILLDIRLPDINGNELLKFIKNKTSIPVIMQSAYASNEDMYNSKLLGADGFVTKPILWDILFLEIDKLINPQNYHQ
jgi:signal transduction histidine kinase/DNA-binding response OmpR family regulator